MGWFDKKIEQVCEEAKAIDDAMESVTEEPKEEWIWVEGYKGTDKDMKCRDFQYTLGAQYDMPEEDVKECESGFHLCLKLDDVFQYYNIRSSNRFFKVKALVRQSDVDKYGIIEHDCYQVYRRDKLVAKSIIFISELTQDEILKGTEIEPLEQKYKDLAIERSLKEAINLYHQNTLIEDGYSEAFANYVINNNMFDKAHAVGSMPDVSMDMKVLFILQAK